MIKYLIVTIRGDDLRWVSTASTDKGMESSRRRQMRYVHPGDQVVVISAEEIVAWNKRSIEELEALARL